MRIQAKPAIFALLCGLVLCASWARGEPPQEGDSSTLHPGTTGSRRRTLNHDDRLALISAALDPRVRRYSERDCSHLVQAIYERAGFPYTYASSDDLYAGVEGFQRVARPQPGDLVVWRGHAGMVIRPSRHLFFSVLSGGPGIDDYKAPYWKSRGRARFYRYVKNDPCRDVPFAPVPSAQDNVR